MVLEKGDSGVCLSATEPNSPTPTEAAGVPRPLAFFVDVGSPATGTAATGAAVRKTPTTSSASNPALLQDSGLIRSTGQPSSVSVSSPRTVYGTPEGLKEDASTSSRKSIGQTFHGALQTSSNKVLVMSS